MVSCTLFLLGNPELKRELRWKGQECKAVSQASVCKKVVGRRPHQQRNRAAEDAVLCCVGYRKPRTIRNLE